MYYEMLHKSDAFGQFNPALPDCCLVSCITDIAGVIDTIVDVICTT